MSIPVGDNSDNVALVTSIFCKFSTYVVKKSGYYRRAYAKGKSSIIRQILSDALGCSFKFYDLIIKIGLSGAMTLATIVYVFVSIGQWVAISHQLEQNRIEMTIANRPWLSIDTSFQDNFLIFDKDGAHGTIWLRVKNVGHSPAIRMTWQKDAFPILPFTDVGKEERRICGEALKMKNSPVFQNGGFALVPEQDMPRFPLFVHIKRADIDNAVKNKLSGMSGYAIFAAGCFDYRVSWQTESHHAPVSFELDKTDPTTDLGIVFFNGNEVGRVSVRAMSNPSHEHEQN